MALGLDLSTLGNLGRAASKGIADNTQHNRRSANQELAKIALKATSNPDPAEGARQLDEAMAQFGGDADPEFITKLQQTQIQLKGLERQGRQDARQEGLDIDAREREGANRLERAQAETTRLDERGQDIQRAGVDQLFDRTTRQQETQGRQAFTASENEKNRTFREGQASETAVRESANRIMQNAATLGRTVTFADAVAQARKELGGEAPDPINLSPEELESEAAALASEGTLEEALNAIDESDISVESKTLLVQRVRDLFGAKTAQVGELAKPGQSIEALTGANEGFDLAALSGLKRPAPLTFNPARRDR